MEDEVESVVPSATRRVCKACRCTNTDDKKRIVVQTSWTLADLRNELSKRFENVEIDQVTPLTPRSGIFLRYVSVFVLVSWNTAAQRAWGRGRTCACSGWQVQDEEGIEIVEVSDIQEGEVLYVVVKGAKPDPKLRFAGSGPSPPWAAPPPAPVPAGPPKTAIQLLQETEKDTVKMQIMSTVRVADLRLVRYVGGGQNGAVFAVRCTKPGFPSPERLYALKMVYFFGTHQELRLRVQNEFDVLAQLNPHENLCRYWAQFDDEVCHINRQVCAC